MNCFLLNLRATATIPDTAFSSTFSQFSAPNIRIKSTFLGNIGEKVTVGEESEAIEEVRHETLRPSGICQLCEDDDAPTYV